MFFASEGRYTQDDLDQSSDIYSVGVPDMAADERPGPGTGETPVEGARSDPPPASPDTTPPRLTALRRNPQRLRVTRRGRIVPGASMQIGFRLSEAAVVTLAFERAVPGRRGDGRCASPAPRNRAGAPCRRYVRIAGPTRPQSRPSTMMGAPTTEYQPRSRIAFRPAGLHLEPRWRSRRISGMSVVPGAMEEGLDWLLFWGALAFALSRAFVAALPVNRWLLTGAGTPEAAPPPSLFVSC